MSTPSDDPMRRTFELAVEAAGNGNHPFGALLLDPDGNIMFESENTVITDNDITAHAEMNCIRSAVSELGPDKLKNCTLYASTEPCPMCTGALYWSGIRKLVYGLSQTRLSEMTHPAGERRTVFSCRDIIKKGTKDINVTGPILEDEAALVHRDFWI